MIILKDVTFRYPTLLAAYPSSNLYTHLSLDIADDRTFAILGAGGRGKSTLLHIMAGLVPQHIGGHLSGNVIVNDVDVTRQVLPVGMIGVLFQDAATQLFNTTVEMEIAWGLEAQALSPSEIDQRVTASLVQFSLQDLRQRRPWTLSGGEQKRLALAALWAMNPSIWLLDEPLGGLDAFGQRDVLQTLRHLHQGGTSFVCATHHPEMMALCDNGIVLDEIQSLPMALGKSLDLNASIFTEHGIIYPAEKWASFVPRDIRPSETVVSLKHVCFDYPEQGSLLQDVCLDIKRGERVAIIGRNGAGKSTLLRHLNGLLQPNSGVVEIFDESIANKPAGEIAKDVGFLFQRPEKQFFASTVRNEISSGPTWMGLSDSEARIDYAIARFGLTDVIDLPPTALSYGQQRAVTLASLAAINPPIVALDEPTVGLDGHGLEQLVTWLAEMRASEITTIIITHEMDLVAYCDHVIWLDNGRVIAEGSPDNILPDYQRQLQ